MNSIISTQQLLVLSAFVHTAVVMNSIISMNSSIIEYEKYNPETGQPDWSHTLSYAIKMYIVHVHYFTIEWYYTSSSER